MQRDYDGGPMVTDVMRDETALELAEVLAERNQGFMQMALATAGWRARLPASRGAGSGQRAARCSTTSSSRSCAIPRRIARLIAWLDSCRQRGLRVYGQGVTTTAAFTFTFEDWNLFDDDAAWVDATLGTPAERKQKLADPARRRAAARLRVGHRHRRRSREITVLECFTPETQAVREPDRRRGRRRAPASTPSMRCSTSPWPTTSARSSTPSRRTSNRDAMREIIDYEWILPGVSDGGAHTKFFTGGRYPTEFLSRIVREEEMCSLEHAHWRLSALPAHCAGFRDRGTLVEGAPADVVVYDLERLASLPTEVAHDFPGGEWRRVQRARGYRFVLVNGEVTIDRGPRNRHALRDAAPSRRDGVAARRRLVESTPCGIPRRASWCAASVPSRRARKDSPARHGSCSS